MGCYDDIVNGMKGLVGPGKRFATNYAMAKHCGVPATQTARYMNGERQAYIVALCNILDRLGARVAFPDDVAEAEAQSLSDCERRIAELTAENEALRAYKHKWEGQLEIEKAKASGGA